MTEPKTKTITIPDVMGWWGRSLVIYCDDLNGITTALRLVRLALEYLGDERQFISLTRNVIAKRNSCRRDRFAEVLAHVKTLLDGGSLQKIRTLQLAEFALVDAKLNLAEKSEQ